MLDAESYPADEIAILYRRRWQAELNLRSLKIVLQMDHLRCKTPHRVRNEFYMHLVAYNLIRQLMAVAAFRAGRGALDGELQRNTANHHPPAAAAEHTRLDCRSGAKRCSMPSPPTSSAIGPTASNPASENDGRKNTCSCATHAHNYKKRMAA